MVLRYDRAPLKATRTDEGYFVAPPVLTDSASCPRRDVVQKHQAFLAISVLSWRPSLMEMAHWVAARTVGATRLRLTVPE